MLDTQIRRSTRGRTFSAQRRVKLTSRVFTAPPTVVSRATFRFRGNGMRIRMFVPFSQAVAGYLSGTRSWIRT